MLGLRLFQLALRPYQLVIRLLQLFLGSSPLLLRPSFEDSFEALSPSQIDDIVPYGAAASLLQD